jgi:hypothetical protein
VPSPTLCLPQNAVTAAQSMANKTKPLKFNHGTDFVLGCMQPYNGFVEQAAPSRRLAAIRSELRPRARKQAISKPDWTCCSYPLLHPPDHTRKTGTGTGTDGPAEARISIPFVVAACAHHLTLGFLTLGH